MPEDPVLEDRALKPPHDTSWIALHDDEEVLYWTARFGIDRAVLEGAVKIVGCSPNAVQALLERQRSPARPPQEMARGPDAKLSRVIS